MIDVPVSSVVSEDVPTLSPTDSTVDAAAALRRPGVEAVLVRDESEAVAGIVAASDVVAAVAEGGGDRPVDAIMSTPVVTVEPDTPIGLAADRMQATGIARLPVVAADGTVVGLVTTRTLAPYLSRHRLDVEWQRDPLRLGGGGTDDARATE